ncbi:aminotransferase class-3 [Trichoderma arundinaceum]|uniref:Aminotransferase class-3 n=1 Tax=Trichoderma arundinaceum TaxID=490622 RepID=A0A395NQW0_TRIAR|nr:aminotransferase class-3 [Trichoderma arundinaceum]
MPIHQFVAKSHVFHRALAYEPQKIVSGSGISFTLESGQVVYDASAGPSVSVLGHHQPEVTQAIVDQLDKIAYVYSGSRYTCEAAEALAAELLKDAPGGLVKAIFVNSGSEATDTALKLATQYFCEVGQPKRTNFIARKQSYHGNTLGALSVSGHESRRAYYRPWIANNVSFVDPCYSYRAKGPSETDAQYVDRLKMQLEDEFLRLGPDTVAAFVAETVSGTTLGCVPPVPGYFKAVREVCDKYGALLILDEIMCGMGKTGTMHAWEQEGIRGPDIQMIGKALGGGFVPLSGVLLNQKVFNGIAEGTMTLAHGHTFQAHPTACAAALAVQKIIKRKGILDHVAAMGRFLETELYEEIGHLPHVGNIRGRGLFWAVEFMRDPATRSPFPIEHNFSNRIVEVASELGLNILGNLGKTGKIDVELVILAPPYIITEDEIRAIVQLLKRAIVKVAEEHLLRFGRNGFHK